MVQNAPAVDVVAQEGDHAARLYVRLSGHLQAVIGRTFLATRRRFGGDFPFRSNRCQDDRAMRGPTIRAMVARAEATGAGELTMTARVR